MTADAILLTCLFIVVGHYKILYNLIIYLFMVKMHWNVLSYMLHRLLCENFLLRLQPSYQSSMSSTAVYFLPSNVISPVCQLNGFPRLKWCIMNLHCQLFLVCLIGATIVWRFMYDFIVYCANLSYFICKPAIWKIPGICHRAPEGGIDIKVADSRRLLEELKKVIASS